MLSKGVVMNKRALLKRVSAYAALGLRGLALVGGLLHTKAGRPLLAHWGVGCPVKASPEAVEAARLNSVRSMREQVGAPTKEAGKRSAAYLASAPMQTALVEYRFKDYIADVSGTNIPGRGFTLREHYMSARD